MGVSVIIDVAALHEIVPTFNRDGQLAALHALHVEDAGRAARLGRVGFNDRFAGLLDCPDPVHFQLERSHLLVRDREAERADLLGVEFGAHCA